MVFQSVATYGPQRIAKNIIIFTNLHLLVPLMIPNVWSQTTKFEFDSGLALFSALFGLYRDESSLPLFSASFGLHRV